MDWYPLTQTILVGVLVVVTIYYAVQTHRQANLLDKQSKLMKEQRRKSIQPLLQIGKWSWFYKHLEIKGTDKDALAPGIELHLSNVGYGPALNLSISATCVVEFVNNAKQVAAYCRLHFRFLGYSSDKFLECTTDEAVYFRLDLTGIDIVKLEDKDQSIHFKFEFSDIDHSQLSELKSIPVTETDLLWNMDSFRDTDILPCDNNYPIHLLPACTS